MNWYDAHCHLSEVAKNYDFSAILKYAEDKSFQGWLSNALNREEVQWHQLNLNSKIKFSAGIHPLYDAGTPLTLEDLEGLAQKKQIFAIGEIGLDKRNRNIKEQTILLRDQISLARAYDLPVVLHAVGHYDVLYKVLADMPVRAIWHGFNASKDIVKQFSSLGITFSMGNNLISTLKHDIINAIIEYGNYLLETDAPYNLGKPDITDTEPLNPLTKLISYAHIVSRLNGVKIESLNRDLLINAKQYFN